MDVGMARVGRWWEDEDDVEEDSEVEDIGKHREGRMKMARWRG